MKNTMMAGLLMALCAVASAEDAPVKAMDGILTNGAGMTLYTFDKDPAGSGKSVCYGACAELWPPFLADAKASPGGAYSVIVRDDGSKQWAYKGKPLYLFAKDSQAGERKGENFKEIWHTARE